MVVSRPAKVTQTIRTVVPLWHFELREQSPFVLDHHFSIRRLTGQERSILEEHLGIYGTIHPEFGIEFVRREERPEFPSEDLGKHYAEALDEWLSQVNIDSGYNHAKKVIEAMRLYSTGDVGTYFYMNLFRNDGNETGNPDELRASGIGDHYVISPQDRDSFAAFWQKYWRWKPTKQINRHLKRFMRAYNHDAWYDRLVDFVTSMEGLVLPRITQELSYRFSLRIAWLLGTNRNERGEKLKEARKIYEMRSKIVHGEVDVENQQDVKICRQAEEMNRQLLVLATKNPTLFTKEKLDTIALGA